MKRALLATVSAIFMTCGYARPASALIVTCANCADLATQLYEKAQNAESLMNQAAQLKTELNQAQMMLQNTVSLPQQIWSNVQGDIMQIRNLANAASLLTGQSGSILNRLQSTNGYTNSALSLPENIGSQFTSWQMAYGNSAASLGRVLAVQQAQEQNYTALQTQIQGHSQVAAGQMQAIQAGNEGLSLINTQLQQLQSTNLAAAQEVATRDEIAAERQALADQQMNQFLSQPDYSLTGWPKY